MTMLLHVPPGDLAPHRMGFQKLYSVAVDPWEGNDPPTFLQFDFIARRWEALAPMGMVDWGCAAAVLGGQLYAVAASPRTM